LIDFINDFKPSHGIAPTSSTTNFIDNKLLQLFIDADCIVCGAGSMKRSVRSSVCLSHRSIAAATAGGFAAERTVGRMYQSTAAGTAYLPQARAAAA